MRWPYCLTAVLYYERSGKLLDCDRCPFEDTWKCDEVKEEPDESRNPED